MRRALRRLLGSHGFEVTLFEDGPALVAAQAESRFDCILLDLHMPGMNGLEVLERLAASGLHPPVIVITGRDQPGNLQRTADLGACACLLKPLDETLLLGAIRQSITRMVLNQGAMAEPPPPALACGSFHSDPTRTPCNP